VLLAPPGAEVIHDLFDSSLEHQGSCAELVVAAAVEPPQVVS
jgi:hypothetical protein